MADLYLQKQRFTLTGAKGIEMEFELDEDKITIFNERGRTDFKFINSNTVEVLDYWRELFKSMLLIVDFAKSQLDKGRTISLVSQHPKGPAKAKTQRARGRKALPK